MAPLPQSASTVQSAVQKLSLPKSATQNRRPAALGQSLLVLQYPPIPSSLLGVPGGGHMRAASGALASFATSASRASDASATNPASVERCPKHGSLHGPSRHA